MSTLVQFLRGAGKIGYDNAVSGLTATNVKAAIDELDSTLDDAVADVADLRTLSGTSDGDTDLGTFTGTTIPDSSTIKAALQALETSLEGGIADIADLRTLSGTSDGDTDLGSFSGATISDSNTIKGALQELETAHEETDANTDDLVTLSGRPENSTDHGTFSGTTISDSATTNSALQELETAVELRALDADVIKKDGSVAFTGDQSMGSNRLTDLAAPVGANDAARLTDVQAASAGQLPKAPVEVVATSNITLSGEQTIDGVLTSTDRVLVAGQTNSDENGIYVTAAGSWARASDADGTPASEIAIGNTTLVLQGTVNANTVYILNASDAANTGEIGAGTESQEWIIYSRAESTTASNGLVKVGLDFRIDSSAAGDGLGFSAGVLSVNVDDTTIELDSDALRIKDLGVGTDKLAATSVTAAKLGSDVAGTGLAGGNGSALDVEYSTTGEAAHAIEANALASNANGQGASMVGVEDAGSAWTATNLEGVLDEVDSRLDTLEASSGTSWIVTTASVTAADGERRLVDTVSAAVTVTLPATPAAGDEVILRDAKRNTETNAITVARNGQNIGGLAEDLTIDVNGAQVHLVYVDGTTGWTVEAA